MHQPLKPASHDATIGAEKPIIAGTRSDAADESWLFIGVATYAGLAALIVVMARPR
jgi:hypothetical protein